MAMAPSRPWPRRRPAECCPAVSASAPTEGAPGCHQPEGTGASGVHEGRMASARRASKLNWGDDIETRQKLF